MLKQGQYYNNIELNKEFMVDQDVNGIALFTGGGKSILVRYYKDILLTEMHYLKILVCRFRKEIVKNTG